MPDTATAPKSKRIAFTFDERTLAALEEMMREGKYSSMAETVRDSLRVVRSLQSQASHGYKELVVRNDKGEERVLIIPSLSNVTED